MGRVARDADGRLTPALFISLAGIARSFPSYFAGMNPGLTCPVSDRIVAQRAGRVAAHELGHYLLQMTVHPATGLMRSEYLPQDLVDGHQAGSCSGRVSRCGCGAK